MDMNWKNLIEFRLNDNFGFDLHFGPLFVALVVLLLVVVALVKWFWLSRWQPVEVEIKLGGIGKVKIKPNPDIARIAHQAYVELMTRKAGIKLDRENDVIVEVYNSWYELFKEFRSLANSIPAEMLHTSKDAQQLVDVIMDALNLGLRPHLTKWQARFRHWYDLEVQKQVADGPQQVQERYPEYGVLVADLEAVNDQLRDFAEALKQIAQMK